MKFIKLLLLGGTLLGLASSAHAVPVTNTEVPYEVERDPAGWKVVSHPTSEPATRMVTPADDSELVINVNIDHKAKYYIWVRGYAPTTSADSVWLLYDKETTSTQVYFNSGGRGVGEPMAWVRVDRPRILEEGTTTLRFKKREAGFGLDKIIVTALPNFNPALVGGGLGVATTIDNSLPAVPAWTPPPNGVLPTTSPRLFLPKGIDLKPFLDAERARDGNADDPEYVLVRGAWDRLKDASEKIDGFDGCTDQARSLRAKALYFRLFGDVVKGDQVVAMLRPYLDKCTEYSLNDAKEPVALKTRPTGEMIVTSALVYDWVLSARTDADATSAKELIIRRFLERAAMEIGFPPTVQNPVVGHGAEAQLLRDQLSAAIAFNDRLPGIYSIVGKRFFEDFVPVRDYVYDGGGFFQGSSYGPYRYQWDMFAAWIYKRMNKVSVFNANQELQLYHSIYQRRPDGQLMRDGDIYHSNYFGPGQYWTEPLPFMLAAHYYNNARLKREFVRQVSARIEQWPGKAIIPHDDDLWVVLFSDPSVKAAAEVTTNPWPSLSRYFGIPMGSMIARTGWTAGFADQTASPVVVASMKIGHTRFGGHQHRDAGHFEIFYKGALASSSGIYQGFNDADKLVEYSSEHDLNYYKRTVAHNAVTVRDPNEKFDGGNVRNDGGQLFERDDQPESLAALQPDCTLPAKCYAYGRAIKQRIGVANDSSEPRPPFSYLMGDITDAYSDKVSSYQRGFVFLNLEKENVPAALIVFDRIKAAATDYEKRWLLHSVNTPKVDGQTITITTTNGGGQLVNRTLLPEKTTAERIEGFRVDGQEYNMRPELYTNSEEQGRWRVEINPGSGQEILLNVMQVVDVEKNRGKELLATPLLMDAARTMVGVRIDNRAVYFANSALPIRADTTLNIDSGPVELLVTGLASGKWIVTSLPGGAVIRQEVAESHGTLYLPATPAGTYVLKREGAL